MVTIGGKRAGAMAALGWTEENIPKKFRDHAWFVAFAGGIRIAVAVLAGIWDTVGPRAPREE